MVKDADRVGEEKRVKVVEGEDKERGYGVCITCKFRLGIYTTIREFAVELRYCMHSAQVRVIIIVQSDKEVQSGLCGRAVREEKRGI